jgi:AraC-like DNA-binding protein
MRLGQQHDRLGRPRLERSCSNVSSSDAQCSPGSRHEDFEIKDHAHGQGDDCTAIFFDDALIASLWGGEPQLPSAPIPTPPRIDIEHARSSQPQEPETTRSVPASERSTSPPPCSSRSTRTESRRVDRRPAKARKALADAAKEALGVDPELSLTALSRLLAASPHHLSRVFRAETGHTIAAHRTRLRARDALERLAGGERDLARLAAETGFADQSHLTRVLRAETGRTPSTLRELLA